MYLEMLVTDVIEGRREAKWLKGLLLALSGLFEAGVKLRHFAFDQKWLKEKKVSVPVVSVGNIIAGGTGKTALIKKLGKDLSPKGKVSILSRGYRSEVEKSGGSLHLMERSRVTPEVCGDEAYLLFKALPGVHFFIGKNRALGAERAVYHDAELILLDDGMQYRSLHRDLEIVMLHGDDLYGKGHFLPRGYLRDSPKRLAHADAIFVHHIKGIDHFHAARKEVAKHSSAPLIGTRMRPLHVKFESEEGLKTLEGKRVGVFCGLGKPTSFFETVAAMGGEIMEKWILPDHVAPKEKQLKRFARRCEERGCDLLICSEKDRVKLPKHIDLALPLGELEAELEITMGHENYHALILKNGNLDESS